MLTYQTYEGKKTLISNMTSKVQCSFNATSMLVKYVPRMFGFMTEILSSRYRINRKCYLFTSNYSSLSQHASLSTPSLKSDLRLVTAGDGSGDETVLGSYRRWPIRETKRKKMKPKTRIPATISHSCHVIVITTSAVT